MSIKQVKPTHKSKFKQGYYKPVNPQKYVAQGPVIYRSSWERKFCHWCDHNPDVIAWVSEPFSIPYFNVLDNKYHKYYPDFYIKLNVKTINDNIIKNEIIEYVIEVKPKSQLQKPTPPKRKTKKAIQNFKYAYESYVRNLCKIEALNIYAKQRDFKVMLLTEESKLF